MSCNTLSSLTKICPDGGLIGGVMKSYMIRFSDLAPVNGVAGTPVYTVTDSGVVSQIKLQAGAGFVEIGALKDTQGLSVELIKNTSNATAYFNISLVFSISGISKVSTDFISTLLNQDVVAILQDRNGNYFAAGLNGGFELSAASGGTGINSGDLYGYSITISGKDSMPAMILDPTIIPQILNPVGFDYLFDFSSQSNLSTPSDGVDGSIRDSNIGKGIQVYFTLVTPENPSQNMATNFYLVNNSSENLIVSLVYDFSSYTGKTFVIIDQNGVRHYWKVPATEQQAAVDVIF